MPRLHPLEVQWRLRCWLPKWPQRTEWPPMTVSTKDEKKPSIMTIWTQVFPYFRQNCHVKKIFYEGQISGVKGEFKEHHFLSSSRFRRLVKLEKPMLGALFSPSHRSQTSHQKSLLISDGCRCASLPKCYDLLANTPTSQHRTCMWTTHTDPRSTDVFFFGTCAGCENTMQNIDMINMTLICSPLMESVLGWCF